MLDLLETLFSRYGIRSLRYDGKMSREARELVLSQFRKSGGPKVILIRCVSLHDCDFSDSAIIPAQSVEALVLT